MAVSLEAYKNAIVNPKNNPILSTSVDNVDEEGIVNLDEMSDSDDDHLTSRTPSLCNVSLGNLNLTHIMNGFSGENITLHSFDKTFTKSNIKSWFQAVGFLPMPRKALDNPKVM